MVHKEGQHTSRKKDPRSGCTHTPQRSERARAVSGGCRGEPGGSRAYVCKGGHAREKQDRERVGGAPPVPLPQQSGGQGPGRDRIRGPQRSWWEGGGP